MSGSLNRVQIIGNLGADPEIKHLEGSKLANMRIATSDKWKDRNTGEQRERTEWHSVAVFSDGLVGVIEQYLKKGSKVYVEGELRTRKWQDKEGNDRYSTEIVLQQFGGKLIMLGGDGGRSSDAPQRNPEAQAKSNADAQRPIDDEIPF